MVSLMVILLLKLIFCKMEKEKKEKEKEEKKKDDLLTCMASPQVKMNTKEVVLRGGTDRFDLDRTV